MPKYLVTGTATISLQRIVEAAGEDDAIDECASDWDLHYNLVGPIENLEAEEVTDAEYHPQPPAPVGGTTEEPDHVWSHGGTNMTQQTFADGVYITTDIQFDWIDRLRILWHGRCQVRVATHTEHRVGRILHHFAHTSVPHILPQRTAGYAEAGDV